MNLRRSLLICLTGLAVVALPPTEGAASVIVRDVDEVLRDLIHEYDGTTYLTVESRRWDLVTDPSSPELSALGDGAFHPMSAAEVDAALRGLGDLLDRFDVEIVILPFPRRSTLKSSCEGGTIFLSPGIRPVSPEHVRATVVHELGHVLHQTRAPAGSEAWADYQELRDLDPLHHHAGAAHRDRPHEIFAEDFRVLLGGPVASASAAENPDLPAPGSVPGLEHWLRELARTPAVDNRPEEPQTFPNPFARGTAAGLEIRFLARAGVTVPGHADIYDLQGRRVRSLRGSLAGDRTVAFFWDGRTEAGKWTGSGFYFVRWRERPEAGTARVQLLR
ncbi:MAG: hypothetical protein HKN12_03930 [Gemmatimonadetes bacterium]|nr:hypothetical protein [Gemmatimonadota bacterium]